jgi:hypothetical protein
MGEAQEREDRWFSHSMQLPVASGEPSELERDKLLG